LNSQDKYYSLSPESVGLLRINKADGSRQGIRTQDEFERLPLWWMESQKLE